MTVLDSTTIPTFLTEDFLLQSKAARRLYHDYAASMPIIDYHCHLPPDQIANNLQFDNLTHIWLRGDHYKWRALRTHGVEEKYITGEADDFRKHVEWCKTVPHTMRNPLYHWSHLELSRYFDYQKLINADHAEEIYLHCNQHLESDDFRVKSLIRQMRVEVICTTDDPVDDLAYHKQIADQDFETKVYPAFRPDKSILIEKETFNNYIAKLQEVTESTIACFADLLDALRNRVEFFHTAGCRISDHGLEEIHACEPSDIKTDLIFKKKLNSQYIEEDEIIIYQNTILFHLCKMYSEKDWVQQFHLGAFRNNNTRMFNQLGPDVGFDSIGDYQFGKGLVNLLDRLDQENNLAKTILYNLHPKDNALLACLIGNFNDGSIRGKMQFGSAWWFLDTLDGMSEQMNALSNMGLISVFVGMLTDSRSFLSYPRHEYFRRLLCNLFGEDIQKGLLPNDFDWIGKIIQDICYNNAKSYFGF